MRKLSAKETNRRISLYTKKGLSVAAVANAVGVSPASVHATLKRAGVQMRPVGRPKASN